MYERKKIKRTLLPEMVKEFHEETGMDEADAKLAILTTMKVIKRHVLAGERVVIQEFGTFFFRKISGRVQRSPMIGGDAEIPPTWRPIFTAAFSFRDEMQKNHEEEIWPREDYERVDVVLTHPGIKPGKSK